MDDSAEQHALARTQPGGLRTHGGSMFVPLSARHPAHAATWNQIGQITYQAPSRQALTATACLGALHNNLAAVYDMAKKGSKKKEKKESPGQTGSLDPVEAGTVAKAYNVKLQLADASESAGPPKDLDPNDVPAWRTKMCENRISVLQNEKRKLRERERDVQREIERKTALRNRAAADLNWKKKEIGYVEQTITDFRKELAHREQEVAEHIEVERAAILAATQQVGVLKRSTQKAREGVILDVSAFDLAERRCKNQSATRTSMITLSSIFATIEADKAANGETMREKRAENIATIEDVALKDLERLQKVSQSQSQSQTSNAPFPYSYRRDGAYRSRGMFARDTDETLASRRTKVSVSREHARTFASESAQDHAHGAPQNPPFSFPPPGHADAIWTMCSQESGHVLSSECAC